MMHRVPQAGLTLPAVAGRELSEGLGRTARIGLADLIVASYSSAEDLCPKPQQFLAPLRLKPLAIELAPVEEIVPHPAN